MLFKYKFEGKSKIGFSLILCKKLIMKDGACIGSFNVISDIDCLFLDSFSSIGTLNYITGYPEGMKESFSHVLSRKCELNLGQHSAITSRHYIDCTSGVYIGEYASIVGVNSKLFTHSIDIYKNRQDSKSIFVGKYSMVGTCCVLLPGAYLPDYSILGSSSLLSKKLTEINVVYGGAPALVVKKLEHDEVAYFKRQYGYVR